MLGRAGEDTTTTTTITKTPKKLRLKHSNDDKHNKSTLIAEPPVLARFVSGANTQTTTATAHRRTADRRPTESE